MFGLTDIVALFANEAWFFRFRVFFRAYSLLNEVGDPPFFYIPDITNSSTLSGKSLRKKSMLENFRANVLKHGERDYVHQKVNKNLDQVWHHHTANYNHNFLQGETSPPGPILLDVYKPSWIVLGTSLWTGSLVENGAKRKWEEREDKRVCRQSIKATVQPPCNCNLSLVCQ